MLRMGVRWWTLAMLLAWEVRSQAPQLPEGQPCPSVCTDLENGCPPPDEPAGDAPERYVGDPHSVHWPDGAAHPLCQVGGNLNDCCACGGGSIPDSCPQGRELQFSMPVAENVRSSETVADFVAEQIGNLAWRATVPNLLRRDLPRHARYRVRIISIENSTREQSVQTPAGSQTVEQDIWVITFYFAAWYRWFPSSTDLENAFALAVAERPVLEQVYRRSLPPLLRVAPPDMRPYPNSIAYAEYQAGVGREEPVCEPGAPMNADNCPRQYTHRQYPPEQRDLARNTTAPSGGVSLFSIRARPLVPGGGFVFPSCAASHNVTWANEQCPVEDTTYCDEFHSLDLDCDGLLSLPEAAETTTWFDEPSYHGLTPLSLLPRDIGGLTKMMMENHWRILLAALDGDDDGFLSMFDWLKGSRVYKPTYRHCGEVLADEFFRYINQGDRSLGGDSGAYPVRPCAACEMRWIYCELDVEGGGWNLVYESVGRADFLMSTGEVNVDRLWDPSFGSKTADRYVPYPTQGTADGRWNAGPTLKGGRDPQGAKLDDESSKHLCDGQYMIHRPGQHPTFCRFLNVSQYGDNAESVKACSFDHDTTFRGYQILEPELGSSFGFSTGVGATGVGTFGFVTQLGYLWGAGGYYTLANAAGGGSAAGGDADYGASSHWVSPEDPHTQYSHYKPIDREVLTCHGSRLSTDCDPTQTDPLRGPQAPSMYVEEQCLCAREYTAETTSGKLQRYGYVTSEAAWLSRDGGMTDQVRCGDALRAACASGVITVHVC